MSTRRRPLRWIVGILVVLVVACFAANQLATSAAQSELASRAQAATDAASAGATVGPFPMLAHLLGQGIVPAVTVTLHGIDFPVLGSAFPGLPDVVANQVDVDLTDVSVSRGDLFRQHKVVVTAIGSATITATVTASELSSEVGLPVTLPGAGEVQVEVDGVRQSGMFRVVDEDTVELVADGVVVSSVALRRGNLLPPCVMTLSYAPGQLTATCSMTPVPPGVVAAMSAG